jgi:hypothetical protein
MRAFGFDPDGGTKLEMIAQPNSQAINRYARKSDHSCIKILMDMTYGQWWPYMNCMYYPGITELDVALFFQTAMDQLLTPDPENLIFHNIEFSPILASDIQWVSSTVLTMKVYTSKAPTVLSWLEYLPGTNPLTTFTGFKIPEWNQMYLPL